MTPAEHGQAWRATQFGEPVDVLALVATSWAPPSPSRVLVRVHACGVGLPDLLMTKGKYPLVAAPPVFPGQEVCGEVVAVAPDSRFAVGDLIMGLTPFAEGHGGLANTPTCGSPKRCWCPRT